MFTDRNTKREFEGTAACARINSLENMNALIATPNSQMKFNGSKSSEGICLVTVALHEK